MKAAIYTLQSKYYKSQMLVAAFALFLQRSPVVRIATAMERTIKVPFARLAQFVAVAFTASSIPQSVTGATTFSSNPSSPATAKTGESFNMVFSVTGAKSTAQSYRIVGTLPQGLSIAGLSGETLNSKNGGTITGTPTETGTFDITVQAYSSTNRRGDTNGKAYPISIIVEQGAPPVPTTSFTATPSSPTTGVITQSFSQSFSITGITAASWEVLGNLPPGLSVSGPNGESLSGSTLNAVSGTISGTPTTAGTYNLTVQAYDATNLTGVTDNKQYPLKITVSAPSTTFSANPSSTATGEAGQSFSQSFSIAGITAGSWKVLGTLPPGLSVSGPNGEALSGSTLNAVSGTISGTPTTAGTYNLTVQAYSAANLTGFTDGTAHQLKITISAPTTTFSANPSSTETGNVGQSFSQSFSIAGITAGSWKVLGTLPPGLTVSGPNGEALSGNTLNAVSGTISGTPTTTGTYDLTVQAYDAADLTGFTDGTAYPLKITISQAPFAEWSLQHFNTPSAPLDGDLDGDGFNNLLEYALGLDPSVSDGPQSLKQMISPNGAETRFITNFERVPGQTDIDIIVETTSALNQAWTPIATSAKGAPFSGSATIKETTASNTSIQVSIEDTVPSSSNLQRFQRVRVVKN